jgi:hypothetical protein
MVSPNVNRILEEAQSLSSMEREELRKLLLEHATEHEALTRQPRVRQGLVERGLVDKNPPRGKGQERYTKWQPIAYEGKPLSETIVEERR